MRYFRSSRGFTLIELSVVLVVLALLAGAALTIATQEATLQKTTDLQDSFKDIEDAMLAYRKTYNRLPCPADPALATSHANFGRENVDASADCVTMLGTTNTAYGAVPVKALGLPDERMFDAWGRKYRYYVDARITDTDAFTTYSIDDTTIGDITVLDLNGNSITTKALYAVISHGKNGHGAYTRGGTAFSNGSTNTDEQNNCDCNASGTYVSPGATSAIVIKPFTSDPTNASNVFDDFGFYKMRFQMPSSEEALEEVYDGNEASFYTATAQTPGINIYTLDKTLNTSVREANIVPPLPGPAYSITMSPENKYVFVGHTNGNYLSIFQGIGTTLVKLANPASPGNIVRGLSLSRDGKFLAVATETLSAAVYTHNNGALTLLSGSEGPQVTLATGRGVAMSSDATYLAAASNTAPYLTIYKRTNKTFNKLPDPATMPVQSAVYAEFSSDDRFLIVTTTALGGAQTSLYIYERSGDTFTLLTGTDGPQSDPTYTYQVSFSNNTNYLAVTDTVAPYIWVYKRINKTFTAITTGPNGNGFDVALPASPRGAQFSKDSKYLILGNPDATTGALVYERVGDTFVKRADPTGASFAAGNTVVGITTVY